LFIWLSGISASWVRPVGDVAQPENRTSAATAVRRCLSMVWLLMMMCGNQYSQSPVIFAPLDFIARLAGAGNKARRGLAVLKSFVGAIRIKVGKIDIGVDLEPGADTADSGDLEVDLPGLFTAVAEAASQ
jgi:hypothetical protein